MNKRGFIAVARGILDHSIVGARKPYSDLEAWLWLLLEAAWKPRRVRVDGGRTRVAVTLERGQLSHSRSYMAEAWGWTEKSVRCFLSRLECDQQIKRGHAGGQQKSKGQTVITVCNYELYQSQPGPEGRQKGQPEGQQRASKGPEEEQGNKDNKVIGDGGEPKGFAEWYGAYPRKKQRQDAAKAYRKKIPKEITHADLLALTVAFADFHKRNTPAHRWQFVPYPASWLNSGEYLDPLPNEPNNSGAHQNEIKIEPPTRDPKTFTDAEWRLRLTDFNSGQPWPDLYWGPAPGRPGCLVPAKLLIEQAPASAAIEAIA